MDIFTKKDPSRDEYVVAHALAMLGMKKIGQEKVDKIIKSDEIKYVVALLFKKPDWKRRYWSPLPTEEIFGRRH